MSLDGALARLETTLDALKDKPAEVENVVRRIRQIRFDLQFIVTGADKKFVYWTERRGRGLFLRASPIDVSGLLEDKLFGQVETVVLTSATLSSAGNFAFIRERLGLDKAEDLIAESTFDYQNQALLYLPPRMPDPRSSDWAQAAAAEVIKIVNATLGRAFVLSTSLAGMQSLYDLVMPELDYPCFLQGSASKGRLLARFRETPNAVLFATSSFWQGVDVRGEQLSCVIIDKLPFAVPTDPIVAARQRTIEGHVEIPEWSRVNLSAATAGGERPRNDGVTPFFTPASAKTHPEICRKAPYARASFSYFAIYLGIFDGHVADIAHQVVHLIIRNLGAEIF